MKKFLIKIWNILHLSTSVQWIIMWLLNTKFLIGVVGIVLDENDRILLFKYPYRKKYPWGVPGGWLKRGETIREAIVRETKEEVGMKIRADRIIAIESGFKKARLDFVLLCSVEEKSFKSSHEISDFAFFSYEELPKNLHPEQMRIIKKAHEKNYI